ncbi:hypothetical protein D4T53_13735 [Enterococcus faecium]|uniref:Uncharacterized protein n=2 Tax=Candidatus Enterococcus wittei TaxID=1987383 RepID=A0A242JWA3_9ENTE|nr:hypothetical protein [Enterococcus faecium]EGP5366370.1 hypothetical protein [Enterococcus faecium]OTP09598.1 hypothetical protein A5844_002377 [Enterococcus sp. 10A9_DIV0425]
MLDGKQVLIRFIEANQLDITNYIYIFTEYKGVPYYSFVSKDSITMLACVRQNLVSVCNMNTKEMKHYLLNQETQIFMKV